MTDAVDTTMRTAATSLEIAASPDAVWRALTEAPEIVRWFALDADVEPGPGGSVTWRWADAYRWSTRIELWEPMRRLRLSYAHQATADHGDLGAAPSLEGGHELVVDFEIEAADGGSWLRCVHSGFGRDSEWDNELEGVRRGWLAELASLRHYLEHHRGLERRVWWAFTRVAGGVSEAWRRVAPRTGEGGLIGITPSGALRLSVRGLETELTPVRLDPPGDVVARVPEWRDAMLRIWTDPHPDGAMVSLFLSHYGERVDAESVAARATLLNAMASALEIDASDATVLQR